MFNPCEETITIHKHSTMGILSSIDVKLLPQSLAEVDVNNIDTCEKPSVGRNNNEDMPDHVRELYERDSDGLNDMEKRTLDRFFGHILIRQ